MTRKKWLKKVLSTLLFTAAVLVAAVCVSAEETSVCGTYAGEKYIEAMDCEIALEITLKEDGTYTYYRAPMVIAAGDGSEMPELTEQGTYETSEEGIAFQGETLGTYTAVWNLEGEERGMEGSFPTGGPSTELILKKMEAAGSRETEDQKELPGDYYIDLTELGMNLTIYLHLGEDGRFLFSNTPEFETNKSSGTYQETEDGCLMVYDSVNGEAKNVSDGLMTIFTVQEDGSLDFTGENGCIYYGIATAAAPSEEEGAKLMAFRISEDYEAPQMETAFQTGIYAAQSAAEDGTACSHTVTFFEDGSFLHMMIWEEAGERKFESESGTYRVSTTQLALEIEEEERIAGEVLDTETLNLSVRLTAEKQERELLEFQKTDTVQPAAEFSGSGKVKGSTETFAVEVTVYTDGSYVSIAEGFTETGLMEICSEERFVKQYPDHPETGVRGMKQVDTVPNGTIVSENGVLTMSGLRIRNSSSLNRCECTVTQKETD